MIWYSHRRCDTALEFGQFGFFFSFFFAWEIKIFIKTKKGKKKEEYFKLLYCYVIPISPN